MVKIEDIKSDPEVIAIMAMSAKQIEALGFTEHSIRHSSIVSKWSGDILRELGADEERIRLAEIAGYLHDIGNAVCREGHNQSGALMAYRILTRMGMGYYDALDIMMAIGNHDEKFGIPVSDISSALIIADKADVHKSRVKHARDENNIHDRVNLAAERSYLTVERENRVITLHLTINTALCPVMDYFEIYFKRMQLCRRAAEFLGGRFSLIINDQELL